MSKVKEFLYDNNLQWQASFNAKTDKYAYAYRGTLIITPGKVLSEDKQLHESSVWNELLDHADLPKGDLKKASVQEKIDIVYDEIKKTTLRMKERSYDEIKALKNESKAKTLFGAV